MSELHVRLPDTLSDKLASEARKREVTISSLAKAVLTQYLIDVGGSAMGFSGPRVSIIHLVRDAHVEIRVPRVQRGGSEE